MVATFQESTVSVMGVLYFRLHLMQTIPRLLPSPLFHYFILDAATIFKTSHVWKLLAAQSCRKFLSDWCGTRHLRPQCLLEMMVYFFFFFFFLIWKTNDGLFPLQAYVQSAAWIVSPFLFTGAVCSSLAHPPTKPSTFLASPRNSPPLVSTSSHAPLHGLACQCRKIILIVSITHIISLNTQSCIV